MKQSVFTAVLAQARQGWRPALVLCLCTLNACTTFKPPEIRYDDELPPPLAEPAALADERPRPLHVPPAWTPTRGGKKDEAKEPIERIESANAAARVEPRRGGYFNAVQVFPYSPGALYQIYAAPGQVTDIALEPGEQLVGSGPLSAGDTVRWVVADTESGSGDTRRVHIMVKPTRPAIETNLVVNTDRRTYLIELRAREKPYMPSVAWFYPEERAGKGRKVPATPFIPDHAQRRYRYFIEGDSPPWRPVTAYDDGHKVYVEFSPGIAQGEMPPLFVIGPDGKIEIGELPRIQQPADRGSTVCSRRTEIGGRLPAEGPDRQERRGAGAMTDSERLANARPESAEPHPEDIASALRLRPERPRIVRLSRRVLAGGSALVLAVVCGAALWALQSNQKRETKSDEPYSIDHNKVADGLAGLPKDYAGIPREAPRLGPALPGDLGRPIVAAQTQSGPLAVDAELQRVNQESEAARTSRIFAGTNARPPATSAPSSEPPTNVAASSDEAFAQNGQDRKLAFVNASVDRRTTSQDRLVRPISPFVVQAGTIIPAALITGIRSDLPGQIIAQVTEDVYDTPTGRFRLIPQGARLIGIYDSQVAFGQSRVLLVWTRLILPNGRSIVLERQPGAAAGGYAGLKDEVDHHWFELFKAATLSTLLGVGSELGAGANDSSIIRALRRGAGDSLNQTGQQVVRRNLNIQPTLTVRAGFPVRVIVNRDLVLEPYKG